MRAGPKGESASAIESAATNTAPPACAAGTFSGRNSSENHRPSPLGDSQLLASRPRPAVCLAAATAHSPRPSRA